MTLCVHVALGSKQHGHAKISPGPLERPAGQQQEFCRVWNPAISSLSRGHHWRSVCWVRSSCSSISLEAGIQIQWQPQPNRIVTVPDMSPLLVFQLQISPEFSSFSALRIYWIHLQDLFHAGFPSETLLVSLPSGISTQEYSSSVNYMVGIFHST